MIDINDVEINKNRRIIKDTKRGITEKIRKLLDDNKGNILNEEEMRIFLLDWLVSVHNKFDLGSNNIDLFMLFHEVFNELYCEYLKYCTSKGVRTFAISIREGDIIRDYIGFKW